MSRILTTQEITVVFKLGAWEDGEFQYWKAAKELEGIARELRKNKIPEQMTVKTVRRCLSVLFADGTNCIQDLPLEE